MARPQNSPKGLFAKKRIEVSDASGNTTILTGNSTGLIADKGIRLSSQANATLTGDSTGVVLAGGVKVSNKANGVITSNSTGPIVVGALHVSNQTTFGKLSANSTATILSNSVRIGSKTTYFSSDSTGVKLGSRYISTNTTGNTTT